MMRLTMSNKELTRTEVVKSNMGTITANILEMTREQQQCLSKKVYRSLLALANT